MRALAFCVVAVVVVTGACAVGPPNTRATGSNGASPEPTREPSIAPVSSALSRAPTSSGSAFVLQYLGPAQVDTGNGTASGLRLGTNVPASEFVPYTKVAVTCGSAPPLSPCSWSGPTTTPRTESVVGPTGPVRYVSIRLADGRVALADLGGSFSTQGIATAVPAATEVAASATPPPVAAIPPLTALQLRSSFAGPRRTYRAWPPDLSIAAAPQRLVVITNDALTILR